MPKTAGPRRKILSYRDQTGRDVAFHAAHWDGFEFDGGPWIVALTGPWGCVQVWAASEAEGRRVIGKVIEAAGIDPADGDWIVTRDSSGRSDTVRRFRVSNLATVPAVTMRAGPSGHPKAAGD